MGDLVQEIHLRRRAALVYIARLVLAPKLPVRKRPAKPQAGGGFASGSNPKVPGSILVVHLAQNRFRQIDPIYAPAALRRYFRRCVIEVLVVSFQKPVVNFVQLIVEYLLRKLVAMRSRIGGE